MTERETARRTFAREFNDSSLQYGEHADRSPNFIITPTGAMCNRIFAVGVLTEVENIGTSGQMLYRARLADPTGAFTIYAGQYQQDVATALSRIQTPAYIAVAGKVRIFSPEPGAFYTSIRPEEINVVDRQVRDRWTCHTGRLTLERIEVMEKALASGFGGEELTWHLMPLTEDATGVSRAIDHYSINRNSLEAYRQMAKNALSTLIEPVQNSKTDVDITAAVMETVGRLDTGQGTSYEVILYEMKSAGYQDKDIDGAINNLLGDGRCYEPKIGVLKRI